MDRCKSKPTLCWMCDANNTDDWIKRGRKIIDSVDAGESTIQDHSLCDYHFEILEKNLR